MFPFDMCKISVYVPFSFLSLYIALTHFSQHASSWSNGIILLINSFKIEIYINFLVKLILILCYSSIIMYWLLEILLYYKEDKRWWHWLFVLESSNLEFSFFISTIYTQTLWSTSVSLTKFIRLIVEYYPILFKLFSLTENPFVLLYIN